MIRVLEGNRMSDTEHTEPSDIKEVDLYHLFRGDHGKGESAVLARRVRMALGLEQAPAKCTLTDVDTISERLRMALLDIGEPPDAVMGAAILRNEDGCGGPGATPEGAWRAFSIVMPDTTPCFACWNAGIGHPRGDGCDATRPFTMDCGVAR